MALPILDGNQTSTTLATTVSGGAHYPNHILASSVTISSLPAISGTVTANVPLISKTAGSLDPASITGIPVIPRFVVGAGTSGIETSLPIDFIGGSDIACLRNVLYKTDSNGENAEIVGDASPLPISGTVKVANDYNGNDKEILVGPLNADFNGGEGRVGVELINKGGQSLVVTGPALNVSGTVTVGNSVTIGSLPAISGTVTATVASTTVTVSALPSGALTTRFGSVTTANTAQLTAAVTNNSRKYLLAQNISAGTVTIGIGFSPTTTQGIQLTAGGGISFDSFCPTGAVWWLGATTGATFTILEG